MWKIVITSVVIILLIGWSAYGYFLVKDIEEPKYEILKKSESLEIRSYSPYLVADVDVKGEHRDAMNKGFRILAGYIFGGNNGDNSIPMTAPVLSSQKSEASGPESITIPMTAPVLQSESGGLHTISFVMPSTYTLETLPQPKTPAIRFREVPNRTVAVLSFNGFASEVSVSEKKREFAEALAAKELKPISEVQLAQYDPPWSPPWMRRNELIVEITSTMVDSESKK
jgi:hypothetical protein